jgi:hypothetical protein
MEMKLSWRDTLACVLALFGAFVMFAKLNSYSLWLIGSYKGALGVLAVLGLGILLTNIWELINEIDLASFGKTALWILAASVIIPSLIVVTTQTEFIFSGILLGVCWLAQLTHHYMITNHTTTPTYFSHVH